MLVQKFKKFRKCLNSKRNEISEDDRQSCIGSEGSMDSSSICLDTIAEDLDEVSVILKCICINFFFVNRKINFQILVLVFNFYLEIILKKNIHIMFHNYSSIKKF